jgi:hypothetical protein
LPHPLPPSTWTTSSVLKPERRAGIAYAKLTGSTTSPLWCRSLNQMDSHQDPGRRVIADAHHRG